MEKMEQPEVVRTINAMYKADDFHGIIAFTRDMNPDRIKDRRALEMIGDAYDKSGLYEDAREAYMIAYEKYPQSRSLAYKLALISVKIKNLDDAVDFYEDFCRLAPNDNNRYIIKYIIGRAGGIDTKDLIKVLEQYTARESDEKWLYELARLYHEAGRADECVALCDEIALWYADGEYEKAALELKFAHKALSKIQQARYEQIMNAYVEEPADEPEDEESEDEYELEKEAEIFINEFSESHPIDAEITEEVIEDTTVETFTLPLDKIREILKEETPEEISRTKVFSREDMGILKPEAEEEEKEKQEGPDPEEEKADEEEAPEQAESEEAIEEAPERVHLSDGAGAKIGISYLKLSSKAALVKKPALGVKEEAFIAAPTLKENVDISDIPIASEEDGQIGINLTLLEKNTEDEEIEGQLTIDEFFQRYADKVEDNKEEVAAVEAERLRQIVESVKDMEPTPLYDMSFNTPDSEEFSEEEIIAFEPEQPSEPAEEEPAEEETSEAPAAEEPGEEEIPEEPAEEEPATEEPAEEEIPEEPDEEPQAEEEDPKEPSEEVPAGEEIPEEGSTDEAQEPEEETSEEEISAEEEPALEEPDKEASEEDGTAEEAASGEVSDMTGDGADAAIARFEEAFAAQAMEAEDSEALLGFGDDLADIIAGGSTPKEDEKKKEFVFTDEFRSELKEFLLIEGIEDEIKTACETISAKKTAGDTTGGNLIITGDKKSGKTYLAISVIKAVTKAIGFGSGKVVKVQAQPLNGKNISAVLKKVEGRDLIIENVGYLKDETIQDLINVMKTGEFKEMIVLEGNMLAIENIIVHFPEIEELFSARINIQELSITQWAQIAKKYAADQGYIIDSMAELALHARIDKINVPNARLGLGDIKDIVDSAIAKSSKRNNGKLFAAFSRKNKEETALTESDFAE